MFLNEFLKIIFKLFYASIFDILFSGYLKENCENCKVIEDFSTQFSPFYLYTSALSKLIKHPVYKDKRFF